MHEPDFLQQIIGCLDQGLELALGNVDRVTLVFGAVALTVRCFEDGYVTFHCGYRMFQGSENQLPMSKLVARPKTSDLDRSNSQRMGCIVGVLVATNRGYARILCIIQVSRCVPDVRFKFRYCRRVAVRKQVRQIGRLRDHADPPSRIFFGLRADR